MEIKMIDEYIEKYANNEDYVGDDNAIKDVFCKYSRNNDFDEVLAKTCILDKLYSTRIKKRR